MCLDLRSRYRALQVVMRPLDFFLLELAAHFTVTTEAGVLVVPVRQALQPVLGPLLLLKTAFQQYLLLDIFLSLRNSALVLRSLGLSKRSPGSLPFQSFTVATEAVDSVSLHAVGRLAPVRTTGPVEVETEAGEGLGGFERGNRERAHGAFGDAVAEEVQRVVGSARLADGRRGGAALDVEKCMEEGEKRGNGQSPVLPRGQGLAQTDHFPGHSSPGKGVSQRSFHLQIIVVRSG